MNVAALLYELSEESQRRSYILRYEILDQTTNLVKARLFISPDLFIQVYRNDRYDSTNYSLIHNQTRIFGRDQLGRVWHRHTVDEPEAHDKSADGRKAVNLATFLNEVEIILAALNLP